MNEKEFEYDFPSWQHKICGDWVSCESEMVEHIKNCMVRKKKINKNFRVKTDKEYSDVNTHIMVFEKIGRCQMGCGREEQLLYFIEGDPGHIGSCKKCLFKNNRNNITYSNGKKINFKKEVLVN